MATFNKVTYANSNPKGGGDNRLASIPAKAKHVNDLIDSLESGDNTYAGDNTFSGNVDVVGAGSNATLFNYIGLAQGGYGVYEFTAETDFGGVTCTATDNGLIKTVATIPADSTIISATRITSEVFGHNNTNTSDLVMSTVATADAADEAVTSVLTIFDGATLKSSGHGALGNIGQAVFSTTTANNVGVTGTSATLCWINKGTGNGTAAMVSGKVVVNIKYIGTAAPSINVTV
tara:strand:+ start:27 stop:725 length:699 start_codon:yes stop_codon:yes gene_type:complete